MWINYLIKQNPKDLWSLAKFKCIHYGVFVSKYGLFLQYILFVGAE
jgi:hypothetical protein